MDVHTGHLFTQRGNPWDGASMDPGRNFLVLIEAQNIESSPSKIAETQCGELPVLSLTNSIGGVAWQVLV